jgi:hypothetical protein
MVGVSVIYGLLTHPLGPVGTLYPPDQMPGYEPRMLESKNVKLIQHAIYDEVDELIHPAMYDSKFSDGQVVEMVVSMEGMHLRKDIVSHFLQCGIRAKIISSGGLSASGLFASSTSTPETSGSQPQSLKKPPKIKAAKIAKQVTAKMMIVMPRVLMEPIIMKAKLKRDKVTREPETWLRPKKRITFSPTIAIQRLWKL